MTAPLLGTAISLPNVALAELAGEALDVAWIDLEHGALGPRDVIPLAIALRAAGCEAHVRLPAAGWDRLDAVLDTGVDGVVVPAVERAADAAALVRRLRYPPAGARGFGPRRAGRYGRGRRPWTSVPVRCSVQIESPAAVDAVEEIAAVDGIDALVVGCGDLSLALGAPQDLESPAVRDAVRRVATAARAAGRRFGVAAGGEPDAVAELAGAAVDLVIYGADVRLYAAGIDVPLAALRAVLEREELRA